MVGEGATVLRVGDIVPDFELETFNPKTNGFDKVTLEGFKKSGKWTVLFFYPADYTFVCPTELRDVAEKHSDLTAAGAEVVAVSTDTKFVHLAWRREEKLLDNVTFQMGADPSAKVSRLFGVYNEENGLDLRGTFIINPEGRLIASEVNFYNVGRNASELLRKVRANVYLAKHPDEACPAGWEEGKKTLIPDPKLVGKVSESLRA